MRGEVCIGLGAVLSFTSLLLLIFVHVGQINTSSVPRKIAMVNVNVTSLGQGIAAIASPDPIDGLYTNNASAPLEQQAGLRNEYKFGLYSHCAYVNDTHGICSNSSTANRFQPYTVIRADLLANYSAITDAAITGTAFIDANYLGNFSNAAWYLILIGTICAALALVTGILKHTFGFLVSTLLAILGSVALLIGATMWTVVIMKAESINDFFVGNPAAPVPLGIDVSVGEGVFLLWAAFACLIVSVIPLMISCCTYRG